MITADGQAEEKSRRVGAASFLRKPFDIDDLVDAVQQALGFLENASFFFILSLTTLSFDKTR